MDFLKSAVASAISKGPQFPYTFGDRVDIDNSIWTLYSSTKKDDGSNCSVFAFDVNANRSRLPLARNALRKLRTLRHPGVLRVSDTVETDSYIYIATERVTPLSWHVRRNALTPETIKWGLYTTATTLKFINEDASSIHGNVRVSSIFTSESGEWKLGGFELLSNVKEEDPAIYKLGSLLPDSSRFASPEIIKGGWDTLKEGPLYAIDAYLFGILIYDTFSGGVYHSSDQLISNAKAIPQNILQSYKRLIQPNPKSRLSVTHFLAQGAKSGGFFDIPLIQVAEFTQNMGMKGEEEKEEFIKKLDETADQFPEEFLKCKVLPELLKAVEYGGGGPPVFKVVLKIGEKLSSEEWETLITPCIIRLFSIPDRAIRVFLLDNLPKMIDHLSNKVVNDKLFPDIMTGFTDLAPIVREQSVKSVLVIINKLSDRSINGELLKFLAKTQNDEQPAIRTNTTICLGKIARNLGPNTRTKVLTAAFTRSLRDPFAHARNAALMALAATADVFDENDIAIKLLPAICGSLVDKEKLIRSQAMKTLEVHLTRLKVLTANMPDTALPPPNSSETAVTGTPRVGSPASEESWAGWAISSFTKKLATATGEITTSANGIGSLAPQGTIRSKSKPTIQKVVLMPKDSTNTLISRPAEPPRTQTQPTPAKAQFTGDEDNEDNDPDAWADLEEEKFFDASDKHDTISTSLNPTANLNPTSKTFEEEPDFESLLNKSKKELPKGLTKSSASRTTLPLGKNSTTSPMKTTLRIGAANRTKPSSLKGQAGIKPLVATAVNKTPTTITGDKTMGALHTLAGSPGKKTKDDDDDDGWGDNWLPWRSMDPELEEHNKPEWETVKLTETDGIRRLYL